MSDMVPGIALVRSGKFCLHRAPFLHLLFFFVNLLAS